MGETMISEAFDIRALSNCGTILFLLEKHGVKPEGYLDAIKHEIGRREQKMRRDTAEIHQRKVNTKHCPHCDVMMRTLENNEGLEIEECPACRYSEVV